MNKELLEAMELLEKEKHISKESLLEAIENSLLTACKTTLARRTISGSISIRIPAILLFTRRRRSWKRRRIRRSKSA